MSQRQAQPPTIAAVYCRKSTEQNGADADAKSVARQIESARAFAALKGWTVVEAHVYADDAVSGAEVRKLVNRQRLIETIRSGAAPFRVLVMRDASRFSRRDGDEAFGELKAIANAGIEIWFYQDQTRFTFGTFGDNVVGFVRAEMNAEFRRQIAKWTREAMVRKAQAGHVTGGCVFGYDNVRVNGHVERRINETEAAVIRRIYELYASGHGLPTIAHTLNADGTVSPRAQQDRVHGWCASSVREVLKRPLYRGELVYGQTRKRDASGQVKPTRRSQHEVIRVAMPDLRIVPEVLADAVDARRTSMHKRTLRRANGRLIGRPPGEGSPYLLTGLLACGVCGGGMEVLSSASGGRRQFHYRCYVARRKGPACCTNKLPAPMTDADAAVLGAVERTLLHPDVLAQALAYAEAAIAADRSADQRDALEADLAATEAAIRRLTAAIVAGGELAALVDALQTYERRRTELAARLEIVRSPKPAFDPAEVRRTLKGYLHDWQGLLRGSRPAGAAGTPSVGCRQAHVHAAGRRLLHLRRKRDGPAGAGGCRT
jgi:DNA invertase Pin-like site-specific DNA recombinase